MSAFGSWRFSRNPLYETAEVPTETVSRTGQGTFGGLHEFAEGSCGPDCKCGGKCGPGCDCKKCRAARKNPVAREVPHADSVEHVVAESPRWEPWEPPEPSGALDEFRKLAGMQTGDAGYLPSPVSTGNRSIHSSHGLGILDAGGLEEMGPEDPDTSFMRALAKAIWHEVAVGGRTIKLKKHGWVLEPLNGGKQVYLNFGKTRGHGPANSGLIARNKRELLKSIVPRVSGMVDTAFHPILRRGVASFDTGSQTLTAPKWMGESREPIEVQEGKPELTAKELLQYLKGNPKTRLTVQQLTHAFDTSAARATAMVNLLVKKGNLSKERTPQGRKYQYFYKEAAGCESANLVEAKSLSREAAERLVWKTTHKDYKATIRGKRRVLVLRKGGTTSVGIGSLTPDEINRKLPKGYTLEGKADTNPSRISESGRFTLGEFWHQDSGSWEAWFFPLRTQKNGGVAGLGYTTQSRRVKNDQIEKQSVPAERGDSRRGSNLWTRGGTPPPRVLAKFKGHSRYPSNMSEVHAMGEDFIGEADPVSSRVSGDTNPSRKDALPKAGKSFSKELQVAIKDLRGKYGLPRDTGWKAPPAPKEDPENTDTASDKDDATDVKSPAKAKPKKAQPPAVPDAIG